MDESSKSIILHFIPNGVWLGRTLLLFCFISLDFLITLLKCEIPHIEANFFAKNLMLSYGILPGLVIFYSIFSFPLYCILVVCSRLADYTEEYSPKTEFVVDLILGWFIAGAHFNGILSWLWESPSFMRQTVGFIIYLVVAIFIFHSADKKL